MASLWRSCSQQYNFSENEYAVFRGESHSSVTTSVHSIFRPVFVAWLENGPLPPSGCNNSTFPRLDDVSPRQIKHIATRPNKSTFRPCSSIRARSMAKYRSKLETFETGSSPCLVMWDIEACFLSKFYQPFIFLNISQ